MYEIILAAVTAFLITYLTIPPIIRIAKKRNLYDRPNDRKKHLTATPSLGGIAIFSGVVFSIVFWTPLPVFADLQYILSAFVIIFLLGAKDDIDPVSPTKKLLIELLAASILVFKGGIGIPSLYGLFGIYDLSTISSVLLTVFTIIVIINAFNLIDGINGLSGSITLMVVCTLGSWFYLVGRMELAVLSFALAGSVIAFLRFNVTPAKIFMGDTGSLFCGLVCAILVIKFIDFHHSSVSSYSVDSVPAVAIAILILPLFDTLRVFLKRAIKGKSPLSPDRSHIHHMMIDSGLSHMQATSILVLVNLVFIFLVLQLQSLGTFYLLILMLGVAISLTSLLYFISSEKKRLKD